MMKTHKLICSTTSTWKKKENNLPTEITMIFFSFSNKVKEKKGQSAGIWALLSSMVQKKLI